MSLRDPEKRRAYNRAYWQRPEVIERARERDSKRRRSQEYGDRQRAYNQRADVKQMHRDWMRAYNLRPAVRAARQVKRLFSGDDKSWQNAAMEFVEVRNWLRVQNREA
jgi:hypothetical protein